MKGSSCELLLLTLVDGAAAGAVAMSDCFRPALWDAGCIAERWECWELDIGKRKAGQTEERRKDREQRVDANEMPRVKEDEEAATHAQTGSEPN